MSRAASQLISVGGERGGGGDVGKLERDGCGEVTWVNKQPVDRGGDGEIDDGGTS